MLMCVCSAHVEGDDSKLVLEDEYSRPAYVVLVIIGARATVVKMLSRGTLPRYFFC